MAKKEVKSQKGNTNYENRLPIAILSYLIIGLVWYLFDEDAKKDNFVKYHVRQGIVLLIFSIIFSIVVSIITAIFATIFLFIPGIGIIFTALLSLLYFIPLILVILGIVNAASEKEKELPIIGKFANKINL